MGWDDSTLQHSCISLAYEQMPGAYETARSHALDADHVSRLNTETKHERTFSTLSSMWTDSRASTDRRHRHLRGKLYFRICTVPVHMTFITNVVICIFMYVPLLIAPELPNTDNSDARKLPPANHITHKHSLFQFSYYLNVFTYT
jgi:hypothetical protein